MLPRILRKFIIKPTRLLTDEHGVATRAARHISCSASTQCTAAPNLQKFLNYNAEQSEKIVNIINSSGVEQLLSYDISKVRANKLQSWKNKNGPLQSPHDLLEVEGLNVKMLQKFCSSLLSETPTDTKKKVAQQLRKAPPFINPSMSSNQREKIRSCVAVRITVSCISWARLELQELNAPCVLTDWQYYDIIDKKLHLGDLVQHCLYIDNLIPVADCYLLENPQVAQASNNPGNAEQQNINIQKAQITAVLNFALAARSRLNVLQDADKHVLVAEKQQEQLTVVTEQQKREPSTNIFYLRRFLTARLFNHLVGNERVSSEQTIIELMRTYYNVEQQADTLFDEDALTPVASPGDGVASDVKQRISLRGNVQFPAELRQLFSKAERYQREFMGQALLLNLAFVRLVLLQDAESIAKITRNSNKRIDQ